MGAGVSSWTLAREVSSLGQLGVVSGTALDSILVRKLWDGDVGGHMRRALAAFPVRAIAQAVLDRYLRPDARAEPVARPALQARPDAARPPHRRAPGADRRRQLRRGVAREGGPRRRRGDQLPREDPVPDAAQPLRGHARGRRCRPDGRRHPDRDPRRPRPPQPPPAGVDQPRRARRGWREVRAGVRPGGDRARRGRRSARPSSAGRSSCRSCPRRPWPRRSCASRPAASTGSSSRARRPVATTPRRAASSSCPSAASRSTASATS